jgi:hypothetical protein
VFNEQGVDYPPVFWFQRVYGFSYGFFEGYRFQ